MKNSKILVLLLMIGLIVSVSCEDLGIQNDGLIDDRETRLMEECQEHSLTSKSEIEDNLIGEWELIGHGNSVFEDEPEPSINLTISETDLIIEFSNDNVDRVDTIAWSINELNTPSGQFFTLETTPTVSELPIQYFCNEYMYGQTSSINSTTSRMYLYEKE